MKKCRVSVKKSNYQQRELGVQRTWLSFYLGGLNMLKEANGNNKSSMTMIVEGREVAHHFSDEPNT